MSKYLRSILAVFALLVGCGSPVAGVSHTATPTLPSSPTATVPLPTTVPVTATTAATMTAPPSALPPTPVPETATPLPTATPEPVRAWLDPGMPLAVRTLVGDTLAAISPRQEVALAPVPDQANLRVAQGLAPLLMRWVYVPVVPFATLADDLSWADVCRFWAGEAGALAKITEDGRSPMLFVTADTLAALQGLLGAPSTNTPLVVAAPEDIVDNAWAARPHAWAIVPFDALEPRWKALRLDGASVLDKGLDVASYPLALAYGAQGQGAQALAAVLGRGGKLTTNRDTEQMTVLMMTGVTALVRATAYEMEDHGVLYPADEISATLRSADVLHISNEVPFAANCPPPNRNQEGMVFCSAMRYIDLLRSIGTDVIELTGNHFQDYGSQATLDTLGMYRQEGWPYFGGGQDLEDARKPLTLAKNGNRFAFIGCNPVGPDYAWATAEQPGAAPCDYDYMHNELSRLADQGVLSIATFQYWEEYQYEPTPQGRVDFRGMVDAGAAIVSGSQAHQPQSFEFYQGGFIHYGLGNLFFDQMDSLETRQEFVDRHVIYKGRHISTELLTYMLEDWAQPRPMTAEERRAFLSTIFQASGW